MDESTFPPRALTMAKEHFSATKSLEFVLANLPGRNRKVLFVKKPQSPYCTSCNNSLVVNTESGYIQPLYLGYCDKCNLEWQVCYMSGDGDQISRDAFFDRL